MRNCVESMSAAPGSASEPVAAAPASPHAIRFGDFELHSERGLLLNAGVPVGLGSRAFAILALLAQRAGSLVGTKEITQSVWPDTFVEENNLRVHLAAIRRVLRSGPSGGVSILNEPGRGYRLVGAVTPATVEAADATLSPRPRPLDPPLLLTEVIGRDEAIQEAVKLLRRHRLVTLVGPGGMGKTTVALSALARIKRDHGALVGFVDLTHCLQPSHVYNALARSLRISLDTDDPVESVLAALRPAPIVILIDNCEHIVRIVAEAAETLLRTCPEVVLFATSREPLRAPGEVQLHLGPLPVPKPAHSTTAADVLAYPSARLLVERATSASRAFHLTDGNAGVIAGVCRNLDGLPLALELAAAAIGALGVEALSSGLHDRLIVLSHGPRTLARHATLRAMLDWSFELLSPPEREVLARLSLFRSPFDLEAAIFVGQSGALSRAETTYVVMELAAKSLLTVDPHGRSASYRLLETTRAYAQGKLTASGFEASAKRRHAEWCASRLSAARAEWAPLSRAAWWERHGRDIDDVRAALDWALGDDGDSRIGVELATASAPLWMGLSQFTEYHSRLEQAFERLTKAGRRGGAEEIRLQTALFVLFFNTEGPGPSLVAAATRTLSLAEATGDAAMRASALWALSGERSVAGDFDAALELALRIREPAAGALDVETTLLADRMVALSRYRLGQLKTARTLGEEVVAAGKSANVSFGAALRYDHTTVARAHLSMTLALEGRLERAKTMLMEAVLDASRARNPSSFCYLLTNTACPFALWLGDDDLARRYLDLLSREAEENRFGYMRELASWLSLVLAIRAGTAAADDPEIAARFRGLRTLDRESLITTCAALVDGEAFARAEAGKSGWAAAEVLRGYGEKQLATGAEAARTTAEIMFSQALAVAHQQGALLWELRAALSLAKMRPAREARLLLEPIVARVEGGELSQDCRAAWRILRKAA